MVIEIPLSNISALKEYKGSYGVCYVQDLSKWF